MTKPKTTIEVGGFVKNVFLDSSADLCITIEIAPVDNRRQEFSVQVPDRLLANYMPGINVICVISFRPPDGVNSDDPA